MRIIGGKYRGKKLISPISSDIRPTSDKAREALFNILRSKLGSNFAPLNLIDVFSGTAAFGLEAVSQGFNSVTLVDKCFDDAKRNLKLFPSEINKIKMIQTDATKDFFCSEKFDVLFMDAPYHKGLTEKALDVCARLLKNKALCLIEVAKDEDIIFSESYKIVDEKRYGLAKVFIAEFNSEIL